MYDPQIGRFYQPDPKSQSFSPYMYAGNSPISMVDPDGELFFTLFMVITTIVCAVGGAYLGGAAANKSWNPAKWDYKESSTYLGMVFGGLSGALLPVSLAVSPGLAATGLVLGTGMGYLKGATVNNNELNPFKWDFTNPDTAYAMFSGFCMGASIPAGVGSISNLGSKLGAAGTKLGAKLAAKFSNKLAVNIGSNMGTVAKNAFIGGSYTMAIGMAYFMGAKSNNDNWAFWEWDWTKASTWNSVISGLDTGLNVAHGLTSTVRGLTKLVKDPKKLKELFKLGRSSSKSQEIQSILKNPKHPLYKVIGGLLMGYLSGSLANNDMDITNWNFKDISTYESILNGMFMGTQASYMYKQAKNSFKARVEKNRVKKLDNFLPLLTKPKSTWPRKLKKYFNDIKSLSIEAGINRLVDEIFSPKSAIRNEVNKLIKNPNLKSSIETFIQKGKKEWADGSNPPPKEVQDLTRKTATDDFEKKTSKDYQKLKKDAQDIEENKNTLYTDEDKSFLKCSSFSGRRRRRSVGEHEIDDEQENDLFFDAVSSFENETSQIGLLEDNSQKSEKFEVGFLNEGIKELNSDSG